jgi:hypothetical protein
MKNKTLKKLIIFGAFAFLLINTNNASAYYYNNVWYPDYNGYQLSTNNYPNAPTMGYAGSYYVNNNSPYYSNINSNPSYVNPYANNNPTPVVNNYYTTTPAVTYTSNLGSVPTAPANTTAQQNNNTPVINNPSPANVSDNSIKPLIDTASGNNLAALSLNGSGGFMPSSVWQWLLVIFLILIIVIIARTLGKKPVSNNPHGVPTH